MTAKDFVVHILKDVHRDFSNISWAHLFSSDGTFSLKPLSTSLQLNDFINALAVSDTDNSYSIPQGVIMFNDGHWLESEMNRFGGVRWTEHHKPSAKEYMS